MYNVKLILSKLVATIFHSPWIMDNFSLVSDIALPPVVWGFRSASISLKLTLVDCPRFETYNCLNYRIWFANCKRLVFTYGLDTCEPPRHNTVPTTPVKTFVTIVGGLESFLMRTILMHMILISTAIPLNTAVLAYNKTENNI